MALHETWVQLEAVWDRLVEQLNGDPYHPICLRFLRSRRWLQGAEAAKSLSNITQIWEDATLAIGTEGHLDVAFMCQWTSFNAMYAQWDADKQKPAGGERGCYHSFLNKMKDQDKDNQIQDIFADNKGLVHAIVNDPYLKKDSWRSKQGIYSVGVRGDDNLDENLTNPSVEMVLDRVYFLRCQLVHGSAVFGGSDNVEQRTNCVAFLDRLLPVLLRVFGECGNSAGDEYWGDPCYRPNSV